MMDELAKRSVQFIRRCRRCLTGDRPLVKSVANYVVYVGRMHSPIGHNAYLLYTV